MMNLCFQSPILMLPPQTLESGTVPCTVDILMNNNHREMKTSIFSNTSRIPFL